jgi:peptide/nickel transport system substrate-binding protein
VRNGSRRIGRIGIALLAFGLVASACGGDDDDGDAGDGGAEPGATDGTGAVETVEGGSITIALGSEPTTLDPQIREDGGERAVNDNVYETLLARDKSGELQPLLAAEMPTQVDDTTWEVPIREGITFHNGEPLTAEVVAASYQRIIDPELASEQASFFEGITSVDAVDETTVRFTTEGPDPILPSRLYWIKIVPTEYSADPGFAEAPIGTGPYKFVSWTRGQDVKLEKNAEYWGDPKPSIDEVTYRFVSEPGTRLSGLISGEFDLITNLLPEDVERAPQFASVQGLEHPVMILNAMDGPTASLEVRQAMNYAVDKEALAEELYGGFAEIDQCQILSPSYFGFNDALEAYPYDPEQAQQLIADAGAEGAEIEVISTAGRWLKDREITEAVANYWTEAGLSVTVSIFEFDEYLDRLFDRETRAPAIFVTTSNELLDAARVMGAYYALDGVGASNANEELTQLINDARVETDEAARQELYAQATQLACDEAYFAFLLNIEDLYGMSERLVWEPRVDAKLIVNEMAVTG